MMIEKCGDYLRRIVKDYINEGELNPLISQDPILMQQCRTRGYMTIPIAGELRNVVCGSTQGHREGELQEELTCPVCDAVYCPRHMTEHLDEPVYTSPRGREIKIVNPPMYDSKPAADLRTEMSSWDNAELNRALDKVDSLIKNIPNGVK